MSGQLGPANGITAAGLPSNTFVANASTWYIFRHELDVAMPFAESLKPCADAEVDGAIGPWTGWASAFADSLLSLLSTKMS